MRCGGHVKAKRVAYDENVLRCRCAPHWPNPRSRSTRNCTFKYLELMHTRCVCSPAAHCAVPCNRHRQRCWRQMINMRWVAGCRPPTLSAGEPYSHCNCREMTLVVLDPPQLAITSDERRALTTDRSPHESDGECGYLRTLLTGLPTITLFSLRPGALTSSTKFAVPHRHIL